jgi:threonine synthase
MRYISTRGQMEPRPFLEILMEGLAPDGGLVVPESIPHLTAAELAAMRTMSYNDLAMEVIGRFVDDIPRDDLRALIDATYTVEAFGSPDITPVTPLWDNLSILELSNGPSLAFKDVAMQFLGHLFAYVLQQSGDELNILGATSGDTGGAAIYAMRSKPGIRVFMLSPLGRTSEFQAAQMYSVLDDNIHNIAIRGVFDDCQDIVKDVGEDAEFKARHRIGTVNSINWARVVAQAVYYFKGYFAVTTSNEQRVNFTVPSGNFGNVYAGFIAKRMGLPIDQLIVATNENDVLHEFFSTGRYAPRGSAAVHPTSSPSMDISKASNFERFVWDIVNQDGATVTDLYRQIAQGGSFALERDEYRRAISDSGFSSGSSSHSRRLSAIKEVFDRTGRIIDTHTADAFTVSRAAAAKSPDVPMLILETALPAKFGETIQEALGKPAPRPAGLQDLETRTRRVEPMDNDAKAVRSYLANVTGR